MGKAVRKRKEPEKKIPAGVESPQTGSVLNRTYLALGVIVIVGLFLRLFEISRKPLWLDEASTNFLTTQPDLLSVITAAGNDHHAPLHFITIWFVKFIGTSEFLFRLPSAVAGALTVLVVFFIARELYSDGAGLVAAALLATAPYHLQYSQEARMYAMVTLFVALAVFLFLRAARTGTRTDWMLFGISCVLAFYTHFYSAFAIVALIAGYGILRFPEFFRKGTKEEHGRRLSIPHDLKEFLTGLALAGVLVLPLAGSFISQTGYFLAETNVKLTALQIPPVMVSNFSYLSDIAGILFVCLALAGIFLLWNRNMSQAAAVTALLVIPVMFSLYLSTLIPFDLRYILYLIPVFLSLVAIPLAYLAGRTQPAYGTTALVLVIFLLAAIPLHAYYTEPFTGQDWRAASETLKGLTKPGDAVVPLPWNNYLPLSFYYNNGTYGTHYRNFELTDAGYRELDNEQGNVYLVITLGDLAWKGQPALSSSVNFITNHTEILSGSTIYDILIAKKI